MNETYEKEIDWKWLCYRVLRAWRSIIVWAVVIALAIGVGSAALKAAKLLDSEFMENARQDFEREHASWVATEENLLAQLKNLEKAKIRQLEYNDESILMQIDPLRKNIASFELYVDYDYKIDPNLTYQPIDLSDRILKSYATYMINGEMYNYIIANLDYEIELRYLNEILSVSVDYDNNMISITVVHASDAKCQEILNLAREGILSRYEAVRAAIDEHKITANNQTAYETIDLTLEDRQEANVQYVSDIDISIQAVNEALREWKEEAEPEFEYDIAGIAKGLVKMTIIGGLVGVVLMILVVAAASVMSGKLLNCDELKKRFGLRIIGKLPQGREEKPFAGISRAFAAFGGITVKPEDYVSLAQMIGSSIRSDIAAREDAKNWKTVAVTGTIPEVKLQRVTELMAIGGGYTVVCASDVLANADSVDKVSKADCVILVEVQEKTVMSNVEKELEALKAWNKPVLGAVVLNTDAVM